MAVPIAGGRHRVDGVDLVAGPDQGADEEPPVDLDADGHRLVLVGELAHHLVQLAHPAHAVGHPTLAENVARFIHHTDVVMVLGPVHSHKEHLTSSFSSEPEELRSALMDQCSRHDIPPAVSLLTNRTGHDLVLGIMSRGPRVIIARRLGDQPVKIG